jgi:hypothetical protein
MPAFPPVLPTVGSGPAAIRRNSARELTVYIFHVFFFAHNYDRKKKLK